MALFVVAAKRQTTMKTPGVVEKVMTPGMRIEATTNSGTIVVLATSDTQRRISWDNGDCECTIEMWQRRSRWPATGGFGLYFPGPGRSCETCGSVSRVVTEEGWQWFHQKSDAEAWIRAMRKRFSGCVVCNDQGLVVAWTKVIEREQLNVEIWQVVIGREKAGNLIGSAHGSIRLEYYKLESIPNEGEALPQSAGKEPRSHVPKFEHSPSLNLSTHRP